uniref:aurora kinase A and ninein-interacting protein n=1 Tax=Gasterosteus aculeatus aculeatus TaxID=481459 RepID=UPI001A98DA8E|nr:aurora kinase A and ninein-interacting protein [Gasterosteus aculeatus aculeatus]
MKTSKPSLQTSAQEECGVWLDTVQLKGRAKQKRLARPISKQLNPFAGGGGYSLAVALNFTQTKMEMPKTKQSSISTFFAPRDRVLKQMSNSKVPNMDPVQHSPSSTSATDVVTSPTPAALGTKRRLEMSEFYNSVPGVNHEAKMENLPESEAALWQAAEEQIEDINPPQSKRRLIAAFSLPCDSQPPQAWSQDPLLTCSQYSEGEFYLPVKRQKNMLAENVCDSEPAFLKSLQSDDTFGIEINVEARTSTQESFEQFHSSQTDQEKENKRFSSFKSPRKHSTLFHIEPLSDHICTDPKNASPQKYVPLCMRKGADKDESLESHFNWTKPSSSPVKKTAPRGSGRAADEDSLAMLFTQDSEGFRVIAHRELQARSPLKNKSNMSSVMVRTSAYKSLVEDDEEDEMLFTQDSQGNTVIKH